MLDEPLGGELYTLRQLLQHRAGLVDYGGFPAYHEAVSRGEDPWPAPDLIQRVEAGRLHCDPGEGWEYSSIGYYFVRRLIEETTGESLAMALARLVLRPLGIVRPRLAQTREDLSDVDLGTIAVYHPGWVYHGLLVGTLGDAAVLLDRLMTGDLLPTKLLGEMQDAYRLGGPFRIDPGWRRAMGWA
jgi:CubicO group peptidase (beta-lactamase class C family)